MKVEQLYYGGVPVPYTVGWTGEDVFTAERCWTVGNRLAVCQSAARGVGKPQFSKPHMTRQREVIGGELCDLCAKPLDGRTKVSLSKARPQPHAFKAWDVLQVEPLLHKGCARISLVHCPSLKRDIAAGTLLVRMVTQFDVQFAMMSAEFVKDRTGVEAKAVGHAKVHLINWVDRDAAWLGA